jgi:hypothetical protein
MRRFCRRASSVVVLCVLLVLAITGTASAHVVYGKGHTYRSSTDCSWSYSEVSHGGGGGYAKARTTADYKLSTPRGAYDCLDKYWHRPAGYLAVRWYLYKWIPASQQWAVCRYTRWGYNSKSAHGLVSTWNFGSRPPCGSGYYGVVTSGWEKNGEWHGGTIWSGHHYLPA